jgi:hypothetical protein
MNAVTATQVVSEYSYGACLLTASYHLDTPYYLPRTQSRITHNAVLEELLGKLASCRYDLGPEEFEEHLSGHKVSLYPNRAVVAGSQ